MMEGPRGDGDGGEDVSQMVWAPMVTAVRCRGGMEGSLLVFLCSALRCLYLRFDFKLLVSRSMRK